MLKSNPSRYTCYAVDSKLELLGLLYCTFNSTNSSVSVRNYCYIGNCGRDDVVRFLVYDDFVLNYYYVKFPLDPVADSL